MPILKDIIDWVENKPDFWQVAIERIIRNNELSDADISELKEICKSDLGISSIKFEKVNFEALRELANKTNTKTDTRLTKIHQIENINALSSLSVLEFAPKGLTLIYGDNGSGKSSYVSILKNICNTRGAKPNIHGNLYEPNSFYNDKKAIVEFTEDGVNFNTVSLINNKVSNNSLKNINVFDTLSANHYIEGEDEIAFIPYGLSLLEKFATYLKRIESELNSEVTFLSLGKFDYNKIDVDNDSSAKIFLNNIDTSTTINQLRIESDWNNVKNERIKPK